MHFKEFISLLCLHLPHASRQSRIYSNVSLFANFMSKYIKILTVNAYNIQCRVAFGAIE